MKPETIRKNVKFIRLVRKNPMLYDHRDKNFRNIEKANKKWDKIAEKMNMTTNTCKKKWYAIRYHFTEYCNKGVPYYLEKELEFLTQHLHIFHYRYEELSAEWSLKNFIEYLEETFVEYAPLTPENKLEVMRKSHLTLIDIHYEMKLKD